MEIIKRKSILKSVRSIMDVINESNCIILYEADDLCVPITKDNVGSFEIDRDTLSNIVRNMTDYESEKYEETINLHFRSELKDSLYTLLNICGYVIKKVNIPSLKDRDVYVEGDIAVWNRLLYINNTIDFIDDVEEFIINEYETYSPRLNDLDDIKDFISYKNAYTFSTYDEAVEAFNNLCLSNTSDHNIDLIQLSNFEKTKLENGKHSIKFNGSKVLASVK